MKIIMSPSKTQRIDVGIGPAGVNPILSWEKTSHLFARLGGLSQQALQEQLNIKGKILTRTFENYQNFSADDPKTYAISLYRGAVFSQLDVDFYTEKQTQYLEEHLCILSAMYGVLEPFMGVWPYRLDMQSCLEGIDLYDYWQADVDAYFAREDLIVNLASQEFSKMISYGQKKKLYTIRFVEEQADQTKKTAGIHAKKARGQMIHELIAHEVLDVKEIKELQLPDYILDESLCDEKTCTFVRPYQA